MKVGYFVASLVASVVYFLLMDLGLMKLQGVPSLIYHP